MRGPHAWGMAWVDRAGLLRSFKQTGKITDALGLLQMAAGSPMVVVHTRFATHGDPADNRNNHPFLTPGDDAFVVHNGIIHDYQAIAEKHRLDLYSECDSEVLAAMIGKFRGKPVNRFRRAAEAAAGTSPFAMMCLWRDRFMAVRANGQPLHWSETRDGWWFGSLSWGLPGRPVMIEEGLTIEIADEREVA